MNDYRKIANTGWEDAGRVSSRDYPHGLSSRQRTAKKAYNRAAKRLEARNAFRDQVQNECD